MRSLLLEQTDSVAPRPPHVGARISSTHLVPQSAMTMIRYLIIFGHFGWCMAGARFEMLGSGRFVGLH